MDTTFWMIEKENTSHPIWLGDKGWTAAYEHAFKFRSKEAAEKHIIEKQITHTKATDHGYL